MDNKLVRQFMQLDLDYFIVVGYMNLINNLFSFSHKTQELSKKLHLTFITPLFRIVKSDMAKIKGDI